MVRLTSNRLLVTTGRLFLGGSRPEANSRKERLDTVFNGARHGLVRTTLNLTVSPSSEVALRVADSPPVTIDICIPGLRARPALCLSAV